MSILFNFQIPWDTHSSSDPFPGMEDHATSQVCWLQRDHRCCAHLFHHSSSSGEGERLKRSTDHRSAWINTTGTTFYREIWNSVSAARSRLGEPSLQLRASSETLWALQPYKGMMIYKDPYLKKKKKQPNFKKFLKTTTPKLETRITLISESRKRSLQWEAELSHP